MILDIISKHIPVMLILCVMWLPAIILKHMRCLMDLCANVKELFGDASHIHAGATKSPGGAMGGWSNIVE